MIDAFILGMVFTKIARPGKRTTTVIFSRQGVVTKRDDKFCLMFRVADVRKRQLSECHVRMYLYRTYKTLEGECRGPPWTDFPDLRGFYGLILD